MSSNEEENIGKRKVYRDEEMPQVNKMISEKCILAKSRIV